MTIWVVILCLTAIPALAAWWFCEKFFRPGHDESGWAYIGAALLIVAALATSITGICGIAQFQVSRASCHDKGRQTGLQSSYTSNLSGCYLKFHGEWVPYERWLYLTTGTDR